MGSYKSQETCFDGISDHSNVELAIPYCRSTCQECPMSLHDKSFPSRSCCLIVCGRFLLFLHMSRAPLIVCLELVMSCFISVHKLQQYILLHVLSWLQRPGVRQSRQDRLKNLVKVCMSTSCASPWEGHLPSACCQRCLLCLCIYLIQTLQLENTPLSLLW